MEKDLFNYYLEQVLTNDQLVSYIMNGSGWDKESAVSGVDDYLSLIDDINQKGGLIYRLLYLNDVKDINYKKLGKHFTLRKEALHDFEYSLRDGAQGEMPYLLTVKVPSNSINKKASIDQWKELPYEFEVQLNNKVKCEVIKIDKFIKLGHYE